MTCEECGREHETEGAEPSLGIDTIEDDSMLDYFIDGYGRAWCRCGARAEAHDH